MKGAKIIPKQELIKRENEKIEIAAKTNILAKDI